MTQALTKPVTYEEFIEWYPENSLSRYKLHKGLIAQMPPPTGKHEEVVGFLALHIAFQLLQVGLPYVFPKQHL